MNDDNDYNDGGEDGGDGDVDDEDGVRVGKKEQGDQCQHLSCDDD